MLTLGGLGAIVGNSGGSNPGSGSGTKSVYSSDAANPNDAEITPEDPASGAIYYQDPKISLYNEWKWSITDQTWYQTVSA